MRACMTRRCARLQKGHEREHPPVLTESSMRNRPIKATYKWQWRPRCGTWRPTVIPSGTTHVQRQREATNAVSDATSSTRRSAPDVRHLYVRFRQCFRIRPEGADHEVNLSSCGIATNSALHVSERPRRGSKCGYERFPGEVPFLRACLQQGYREFAVLAHAVCKNASWRTCSGDDVVECLHAAASQFFAQGQVALQLVCRCLSILIQQRIRRPKEKRAACWNLSRRYFFELK